MVHGKVRKRFGISKQGFAPEKAPGAAETQRREDADKASVRLFA